MVNITSRDKVVGPLLVSRSTYFVSSPQLLLPLALTQEVLSFAFFAEFFGIANALTLRFTIEAVVISRTAAVIKLAASTRMFVVEKL